jgi:hypothetical protein
LSANACYKYSVVASGNLYMGTWTGDVSVTYTDCSGTPHSTTVKSGGWSTYSVGGACTVFIQSEAGGSLQFNSY